MYIPECEKRKQKEDSLHINFINIFILAMWSKIVGDFLENK